MLLSFMAVMSPWWIRNYIEYAEFIPLAASSGNPMLQGSYIGYRQTSDNIIYYDLGKNAFETNKTEVKVAKERIKNELKRDLPGYLKWISWGKTYYFWGTIFYWKEMFGISQYHVLALHYILLLGFFGFSIAVIDDFPSICCLLWLFCISVQYTVCIWLLTDMLFLLCPF